MSQSDIKRELAKFDSSAPIERAWMPPSSWYTEESFGALEREVVFSGTWQPVALLSSLGEPGSYTSGCTAGQPWVITKDSTGSLQAFHNTCRHKGREVVQGSGQSEDLVCGYHAWAYDLSGQLKSAPRMAGVEDFNRAEMNLPPIALEAWGLWAFIHLGQSPTPFNLVMADLEDALGNPRWASLHHCGSRVWELNCNWKVVCDNYLDGGYHIPHMHPTLDAQLDMNAYRTELYPSFSIQTAPPKSSVDERIQYNPKARIGEAARYAWLYPNIMINRYGGCIDTNLVIPRGPGKCEVHYDFFFEDVGEDAEDFIRQSVAQSEITQMEDISICESVQLGLQSRSYDAGRYAPRVETGEHHFHRLLATALSSALK